MFLWYVVNTYSGHENKVKANLEHRIVSMNQQPAFRRVVVPTEQVQPSNQAIVTVVPEVATTAADATLITVNGRRLFRPGLRSYVVVGEAAGSKADDAQRLGVPTLDEAGLLALVRP